MVKIKVSHQNNTIDFDLNREQALIHTIESICHAFTIPTKPSQFALYDPLKNHYLIQIVR